MNRQAEIRLDVCGTKQGHGSAWPTIIRRLLVLCAVAAVALLLVTESRLSSQQRQQAFETSGVYP
jgi:hypothetical protein